MQLFFPYSATYNIYVWGFNFPISGQVLGRIYTGEINKMERSSNWDGIRDSLW